MLVNIYINLALWTSIMPKSTNNEFRVKIYHILKDYQRSGEEGLQEVEGD